MQFVIGNQLCYSTLIKSILQTYGVTKNNPSENFLTINWIQTQYILLLGEQVLTIFLCIKRNANNGIQMQIDLNAAI